MRSSFRLKPICFYLMGVMLYHHSYAEDAGRAGSEAQIQVLEDVHVKAKRVPKDKKVFTDARAPYRPVRIYSNPAKTSTTSYAAYPVRLHSKIKARALCL